MALRAGEYGVKAADLAEQRVALIEFAEEMYARQDGAAAGAVASGRLLRVVGACACSWVAGVGPVEPHREVANHD
jgi:hypothetical protein